MANTTVTRFLNIRHMATSLAGIVILLASASPTSAALYQVTTLADGDDGMCDAHCTLREAIVASNNNGGLDYITIPAGIAALTDPAGQLRITDSVFIAGQGPEVTIIDASGIGDRAIEIEASGYTVSMTALTITGGSATTNGGGVSHRSGHLVLGAVVVRDNQTLGASGGVHSYLAELTIQDGSEIIRNSSGHCGGGVSGNNLTITDSIIADNDAECGGGINSGGTLTISGSTIARNTTQGFDGGGIYVENGTADISNTTIVGNHSGRMGGGVFAGNSSVSLNAVTLSNNSSVTGESLRSSNSTINLTNTLIDGDCVSNGSGVFLTNGGNLESPGNTCSLVPGLDSANVPDPMLWPLSHYGGSTPTMLPQPGSPALGAGDNLYCLAEDQRGEPRSDGFCDTGAVERQAIEADPIFVDGFESGTTSAWS